MPYIFFHTFGCKVNQYETESIQTKLLKIGYQITCDFNQSDICVINSCSVTAEADKKCRQFVRKILRSNLKTRVLVTGCYATRDPEELRKVSPRIEVFSNQQKDSIPELISGCSLFSKESSLLTVFSRHTRAFVKIQDGCDATCTYCIIPKVRPKMESRPTPEILEEISELLDHKYKEIVLSGIRLGSYGLSSSGGRVGKVHGDLVDLLQKLILIPKRFRIRLSSLEITEATDELVNLVKSSDKICPHFHLPLQSGDDSILKKMGRWYDTRFFSNKISMIKDRLPDVGLTTDLIVGFPGETEDHFQNSFQFIKDHFNGMHIFPYSLRAGTSAVKLTNRCDSQTIRERTQKLIELDKDLRKKFQNRFAGQKRMVLAESNGGFSDNGIRLFPPFPFANGQMQIMTIPPPL